MARAPDIIIWNLQVGTYEFIVLTIMMILWFSLNEFTGIDILV
jgi:hypothetical protein